MVNEIGDNTYVSRTQTVLPDCIAVDVVVNRAQSILYIDSRNASALSFLSLDSSAVHPEDERGESFVPTTSAQFIGLALAICRQKE